MTTSEKNTIDALQVKQVLDRFRLLNTQRFDRVQDSLEKSQRIFLDILPLLFHVNHPMLPGFQSVDTPFGISNYSPEKGAIKQVKQLAQAFQLNNQTPSMQAIHAIFIMGSTGTIAYSKSSDFDIWVCHDPDLGSDVKYALQQKANAIESWGESLGLEVHFFILDEVSFKNQQHAELSIHSSGSSQHILLLDEFYRTSILIAGRHPIWWLVPPANENCYEDYCQTLLSNQFIQKQDIIDFGGLKVIPPEEFYSASLWQLNKAIESPYKSILKLNLLESYTAGSPYNQLLALKFKESIYDERHLLATLDPYIMTCHAIEDYLFSTRQTRRLDLVRRCFYFKIDEPLSQPQKNPSWRRKQLSSIVDDWGWDKEKIEQLDQRHRWRTHQVLTEYRQLMQALEYSYQCIKRNTENTSSTVKHDQSDTQLLTKMLSVVFTPQKQTVELFNPGISKSLLEQELTLVFTSSKDKPLWEVYSGKHTQKNPPNGEPLNQSESLVNLLAWCHFNKIIAYNTFAVHLYPEMGHNRQWEIESLINSMRDYFPRNTGDSSDTTGLAKTTYLQRSCFYINTTIDPMKKPGMPGMQLINNQNDPLNYGQNNTNLVQQCDLLGINSWNQVIFNSFTRRDSALLDGICYYLSWFSETENTPQSPAFCNFSSTNGHAVTRRVNELVQDIIHCFYNDQNNEQRYLLKAGGHYYLLACDDSVPRYQKFTTYSELINVLSQPLDDFTYTFFDQTSLSNTTLAQVLSSNQKNTIQIVFRINDTEASIFILDENGALFYERTTFRDQQTLLNPYLTFLKSIHDGKPPEITTNQITTQELNLKWADIPESLAPVANLSIKLNCQPDDLREDNIEITFGEKVFEAGTHNIFQQAAQFVVNSRKSKAKYPVHITNIQTPERENQQPVKSRTIQLLKLKRDIEKQLNQAISTSVVPEHTS
ncbi:MAG: class I adenylate cyclase [Gammaproteobacteria bacterium]